MYSLSKDEQFNLYKVCLLVVAGWKFYESCEIHPWSKIGVIRTVKETKAYLDCYEKHPSKDWYHEFSLDEAYEWQIRNHG